MKYYCDAEDCPGHNSKTDSCTGYDSSDSRWNLKSLKLRVFHCDAPDCPGHFSKTDKCPNVFVPKPKSFELRQFRCHAPNCPGHFSKTDKCPNSFPELKSFELRQFKCGAPNCPGHYSKTEKCRNSFVPELESFSLRRFKCGAPDCPGHQNQYEKCKFDISLLPKSNRSTDSFPIIVSPQIGNIEVPWTESSSDTSSSCGGALGILLIMLLVSATFVFLTFGFERTLVAAEGFFIFAGWAGLRAARVFGKPESKGMETFSSFMAVCFGICCGIFAAYLLLTTSEGQNITKFVTASTVRIVGSLFTSVMAPSLLEVIWRAIFK